MNSQTVQGPRVGGQKQSWVVGIRVPELSGQDKTAKGLYTARVDLGRVRRGAGKQRLLELTSVVELALVGVELCECSAHKQSRSARLCKSGVHTWEQCNCQGDEPQGTQLGALAAYLGLGTFVALDAGYFFYMGRIWVAGLCLFGKVNRCKSWFEVAGGDERCTMPYLQADWDVGMFSRVLAIGCPATGYASRAVMLASTDQHGTAGLVHCWQASATM
jgi:hypothetical protein